MIVPFVVPFFMRDGLGLATFRKDPGVFDFENAGLWETLKIGMKWFGLYQVSGVVSRLPSCDHMMHTVFCAPSFKMCGRIFL